MSTHLVQPRNGAHDDPFLHAGEGADLLERFAPGPLVHHLQQPEVECLLDVLLHALVHPESELELADVLGEGVHTFFGLDLLCEVE